jgi:hypothetical protein
MTAPARYLRLATAAMLLALGCGRPAPSAAPAPEPKIPPDSIKPNIEPVPFPQPQVTIPADTTPPDTTTPRPSRPLIRASVPVRLAMVGDINLGTITQPDGLPPDSGRSLLQAVDTLLVGDLVIGNFEGVLADSGVSAKCGEPDPVAARASGAGSRESGVGSQQSGVGSHGSRVASHEARGTNHQSRNCYAFGTPTRLAPRLSEAGFTHLNLANNHANDFGLEAREHSDSVLQALGIKTYGPLGRIVIDTVLRGDSATVLGLIGFTTYPFAYDLLDLGASRAVVDSVRHMVDVLVVTFHGGSEGEAAVHTGTGPEYLAGEPRGDLRAWSHAVIEAGADAVVGHGPHVLRGVEFYRGKPIFYSLGNFATYKGFNLEGPRGISAVLQLDLAGDGSFQGARLRPLVQPPRQGPRPDPKGQAITLIRRLSQEDFGPAGARIAADGTVSAPSN